MKKLTLLLFAMLTICSASAQETVKLTVSGQGATKEEATANALRSAIEQSFGVFVSANTQILNDEVVKDEIATVASGNIQEYKELGCITMPNGQQSVTLSATVSIGNLISYAKSKGSSAEFAGQVFAMNMKMRKLNAENEANAIHHMLQQLYILAPNLFRVELSITKAPSKRYINDNTIKEKNYNIPLGASNYYNIPITLNYYTTKTSKAFFNLLINTLKSLALSETEVKEYYNSNERIYGCGEYYVNIGLENLKFRTPTIDESFEYFIENAIAVAVFSAYDIEILGLNESHRFLYDSNNNYAKLSGGRPVYTTRRGGGGVVYNNNNDSMFPLRGEDRKQINLTKLNSEDLLTIAMEAGILFTEDECSKITQIKMQKNDDALLHACIMFGQYYGLQQYFKFKEIESAYTFYGSYMEFHSSHYRIKHEDGWSDWITKPTKITYDIISRTWNVQEFGTLPEYEYRTKNFMYWGNYKHGCLISKSNNSKDLYIRIDGLETNNGKPHLFFIPSI